MTAVVDLTTHVGSIQLPNPVMTASGTAGHGLELAPFLDPTKLGAHVVKSLATFAWAGNPAPRLHAAGAGMLNAAPWSASGGAASTTTARPPTCWPRRRRR